ncbi:hypothetical protein [Nocardia jiangxiensis]|uniref:YbaB/EbfC DNA-binding family protein n=1 Tax=Nocardia jiangxiensis TaxID=282685 RepID=A0ABW6RYA7_9NOCA|nr:hypothetical protein [Nocardia jiangxiensis]
MSYLDDWEEHLERNIAEIRSNGRQLSKAASAVRGRSETRGVTVEVDASGNITNLQIAPGAMRWTNTQLTNAPLDCHRRARNEARTKVERLVRNADPRIQQQANRLRNNRTDPEPSRRPMTEEEIQAADDAYFERMNRRGWRP